MPWARARARVADATEPARAPLVALLVVFTAGLVVVYARWWAWYGGVNWGPRFFVVAILPASVILATRVHHAGASRGADARAAHPVVLDRLRLGDGLPERRRGLLRVRQLPA